MRAPYQQTADSHYPYSDEQIQRLTNQSLSRSEKPIRRKEEKYGSYIQLQPSRAVGGTRNQPESSCISIANEETGRRIRIHSEEGWRLAANQKRGDRIVANQKTAGRIRIQSEEGWRLTANQKRGDRILVQSEGKRQNTHPIKGLLTLLSGGRGGTRFQSEDPAGSQ